jgi:hypothetical protein
MMMMMMMMMIIMMMMMMMMMRLIEFNLFLILIMIWSSYSMTPELIWLFNCHICPHFTRYRRL